jgi:sec-independent protein translocase protein TatC
MITIGEYTQLFLSIVLGMGLIFEMPILVFFLALMGIMSPSFMVKNFRYSILVIFIIAAIVTPTPDIVNMCVFAAPMLALYGVSIGVAYMVYPKKDRPKEEQA